MTETPLEKVLRLAAPVNTARRTVPVRTYQRLERGRPQVVQQHVQGHVAGGGGGLMPAASLKAGNVIQIGRGQYTVLSVKPYTRQAAAAKPNTAGTSTKGKGVNTAATAKSTASAGKGVNTAAPKSTATAGAGVSAAADPQAILDAAATAQKITGNVPEVALNLQQAGVKGNRTVLAARTLKIQVLR